MTAPRAELEVLLRFGTHTRSVPLVALAAVTHVSTAILREALSRLLFALIDRTATLEAAVDTGNQTEGRGFNVEPDVNVQEYEERNVDANVGERGHARAPGDLVLAAEDLASELQDTHSVRYYRQLLSREPHELVAAAVAETIARRAEIRGRPGAYFIGVLRALKRAGYPHLHPYARTSSAAS